MCGIAGIIELSNKNCPSELLDNMDAMLFHIKHRGPDGKGVKIFNHLGCSILLGHQRLAIIDLSSDSNQPMFSNDGEYCIVFNGEIYNYKELKNELSKYYTFITKSDTEVLLASYIQWGESMLSRLEGMFSFLIYNKNSGHFWGARDPFGIKPFYYSYSAESFRFASEPIALWKTQPNKPDINQSTVADYLLYGLTDHTERTFFSGIMQLRGGYSISGKAGHPFSIAIKPWWKAERVELSISPKLQVYNYLQESVRIHLRADVPVGGCLSGGLDSGCINHFASKLMKSNDTYFNSITFSEKGFEADESELAAATASCTGSMLHVVSTSALELEKELDQLTLAMGEPYNTLSMYAQFKVFQKASALGLKVMLDGQGGDEVFAGYPRVAALVFKNYISHFHLMSAWQELFGFQKNASVSIKEQLFLNYFFTNKKYMKRRVMGRLSPFISADLLNQFDFDSSNEYFGNKSFEQSQYMELTKYIIPRLLRYEDRNSMHFSIEARVPLLSKSIANLGLSLPMKAKVKNGWTKYAMRLAMEPHLPSQVVWQKKKRGFDVPQDKWISALTPSLRILLNESAQFNREIKIPQLINNLNQNNIADGHIWRLISLQLWLLKNGLSI